MCNNANVPIQPHAWATAVWFHFKSNLEYNCTLISQQYINFNIKLCYKVFILNSIFVLSWFYVFLTVSFFKDTECRIKFINASVENWDVLKPCAPSGDPLCLSKLFVYAKVKDRPAVFDQFYLQTREAAKDLLLIVNVESILYCETSTTRQWIYYWTPNPSEIRNRPNKLAGPHLPL